MASHLLAFGVAGGGIGLRVELSLQGTVKRLQVVLAEGVRAEVFAGVRAQPAAVLVTWHPRAGTKLSGDPPPTWARMGSRLSCTGMKRAIATSGLRAVASSVKLHAAGP